MPSPLRHHTIAATVAAIALLAGSGCFGYGAPEIDEYDDDDDDGSDDGQAANEAAYDAKVAELAGYRTQYLGDEADELRNDKRQLYYLTFPGFDPVLHRIDTTTGAAITYPFSIGSQIYGYRADGNLIVTANTASGLRYDMFAADTGATLDSIELTPPSNAAWHAYATDGEAAYIAIETAGSVELMRWKPGVPLETIWNFEAIGCPVEIFQEFDVQDGVVVYVESGRIWRAPLDPIPGAGACTWLGNETAASGNVDVNARGVVWSAYNGSLDEIFYYDTATNELRNVTQEINTAGYKFNESYPTLHHAYEDGFTRVGNRLVYEAGAGIFLYDLDTRMFEPIVLDDFDSEIRTTWRDPVFVDSGELFVTGLESASGSVGADGPIYRIAHPSLLLP